MLEKKAVEQGDIRFFELAAKLVTAAPEPTAIIADFAARMIVNPERLIDNEHMFPVSGGSHSDDYTSWERGISQDADAFVDVNTLDEYITTLLQLHPKRQAAEQQRLLSPLGMHTSVDFLDAV